MKYFYILNGFKAVKGQEFICNLLDDKGQSLELVLGFNDFLTLRRLGYISKTKVAQLKKEQFTN